VKSISMHVATRNATQVRTHAQKYFLRLERERRKKEESIGGEPYDSSGSFEDDGSPEDENMVSHMTSVSISSLTLPGSPAVMMNDSVGTPPGTPGEANPGTPGSTPGTQSPVPSTSSPIPVRRRRATSFITVAQARLAAQQRDSVLVGLPPTWTVEDYDLFMKGLLSMADKHDDIQTLCRLIREQYLPHHTPDEVELCYRNVLKNLKHKPLSSPKRRRTNSRPEPLSSSLGIAASLAPSFPVPPVSTLASSFPFRNNMHSPTSANTPAQAFSNTPSSPLAHSHSIHSPTGANMVRSPFADYGNLSNGMEYPFGELNLNGVSLNNSSPSTTTPNMTINQMGNNMTNLNNTQNNNMQTQMHGMNTMGMLSTNSSQQQQQQTMGNGTNPITPSSLWGSALPFSFDALMSGPVQCINQPFP